VSAGAARRAVPWLASSVAALSWLLSSAPASVQRACALTPAAVTSFEPWRLWTGHLVHFGPAHLRGDVLAFALWAALLERESRALLLRLLLLGTPLLSLALLLGSPSLGQYRGLSGLDCTLVVALLLRRGLPDPKLRPLAWLGLGAFAAKCGYELAWGHAVLAPDLGPGVRLLPLSHVLGALLGLSALASSSKTARPSPAKEAPCMQASKRGSNAARRSSVARVLGA
jgi:rhomboid family GlyGly-CTERM serine protease